MARRDGLGFSAIRTDGAILPPSLLRRIHQEDTALGGLKPEDYGLSGERIREAASRSWSALQPPWRTFQAERAKLAPGDAATGMTRNRWLFQVLKALDYGVIDPLKEALKLADREYPISHLYGHAPLHLIGCGLDLDTRTARAVGAAHTTPHGLVQLYLNACDDSLWGFVSNGLRWRVLRDSVSLSRQAMVEFDLESILEGQLYDEYLLFYLLCHQSRIKSERPEECWLEKWSQAAGEEGKRALDTLRVGVQSSIEALGQGFLKHPANIALRQRVRDGLLDKQEYYRQLLRLVYRLLFTFSAEDRGLLIPREAPEETRRLYTEFYSTQRLRLLAERLCGSARHHDLYVQFRLVVDKLGEPEGCPALGLPALGGFLFTPIACPDLDKADISNADLLSTIRCLAVTQEGGRRSRVDYKNLGSEELGSVYESLLELHPDLSSDGTRFELKSASGNERKTTGSYYTPESLIQCLLDTALDPVVDQAVKDAKKNYQPKDGESPEVQAILNLKVIDPAVGSGHFLIAAAHRMARRLAKVRTGDDEPSPEATRRALRDVIGRCLYGIDLNPMAAELCKVALWMEGLEPGRPLGFLDSHIQVGNSLLGTTPELIAQGIPDAAYDKIEGDDPEVCALLKKQNRQEREGQASLFTPEAFSGRNLLEAHRRLEALDDETFESVRRKERTYRELSGALQLRKQVADAWCAAFTQPKTPAEQELAVTTATLRILANVKPVPKEIEERIEEAANRFGFLHPHLAFPEIFASGGFDVVLGNPPWNTVELKEEEWFLHRSTRVTEVKTGAERKKRIAELAHTNPVIFAEFQQTLSHLRTQKKFWKNSMRFTRCVSGKLNLFALFSELALEFRRDSGRCGIIVPSALLTGDSFKGYVAHVLDSNILRSVFDFSNGDGGFFEAAEDNLRFSLVTIGKSNAPVTLSTMLASTSELLQPGKVSVISPGDVKTVNPNTLTLPMFSSARDAQLILGIHRRVAVFLNEFDTTKAPTAIATFMFNMTTHSSRFVTKEDLDCDEDVSTLNNGDRLRSVDQYLEIAEQAELVPLYESKLVAHFNHRANTFEGIPVQDRFKTHAGTNGSSNEMLTDPGYLTTPRYWIAKSLIPDHYKTQSSICVFRKAISASADQRSALACLLPVCGAGDSLGTLYGVQSTSHSAFLCANINSFLLDYVLRQKASGGNLSLFIFNQLPLLEYTSMGSFAPWDNQLRLFQWICVRVLELSFTSFDLAPFARDLSYDGPQFSWDEERRSWLRAELDAAFFHLYSIERDDVDYILETFPILKRNDIAARGRYHTKEMILQVYDAMAEATRTGISYQTTLDPPPANGWTPPEKLLQVAASVTASPKSAPQSKPPPRAEPVELVLVAPPTAPTPMSDRDVEILRVRVYTSDGEVALNRGVVTGRQRNGEITTWTVMADGETVARKFLSPPAVVKRLKPKL